MLNTLRRDAEHHVEDACTSASTPAALLEAHVPLLRTILDADAAVVSATDPDTTVLASAAVVDNLPETLCAPWFHNEFLVDDVNRFADLHRLGGPPATIHGATRGHPARSPRFRDLYRPLGLGPEVRTTLSLHGACWGVVSLVRAADKPDFSSAEVAWLERARTPMGHALRRAVTAPPPADGAGVAPGIVTLTPQGRVLSMSEHAAELLADLDGPPVEVFGAQLPGQAYMVATAVRARALRRSAARPVTRARGRSGRWLTVRGDHTSSPAGEIVNTVRDHIKSLLAKTGTSSRGELLSLLLHRHSFPTAEVRHH